MLQWVISVAGVMIFTGLTAYDTQAIKENYVADDDATAGPQGDLRRAAGCTSTSSICS